MEDAEAAAPEPKKPDPEIIRLKQSIPKKKSLKHEYNSFLMEQQIQHKRRLFKFNHENAETKMDREQPQIVDDLNDPLPSWY